MSEVRKYTEAFISSAGNTIHRAGIGVLDLEVKVGVLSSGDLVLIDVSIARFHGGCAVEGSVQASGYLPVFTVVKHLLQRDACNAAEKKTPVSQSHGAQSVTLFQHWLKSASQSALKNNCKSPKLLTLRTFLMSS